VPEEIGVDAESCKHLTKLLCSSIMEDTMEAMFGSDSKIIATRQGFDVEDYSGEHDWNLVLAAMILRKVAVKAKSSKAKNRLANMMGNNPICNVHQDTGSELFLASENEKYFFWVSTRSGTNRFGDKSDAHWEVLELPLDPECEEAKWPISSS